MLPYLLLHRNSDQPQASGEHVNAEYLKGLINVVPIRGPGERAQLNRINAMSINLLESVQNGVNYSIRNVFMPLFECVDKHGLLLVGDLSRRRFFVYDILVTKRAPTRTNLMNSAKDEVAAALSTTTQYSDARSWDAERALCPQQENGHDCGVFVMVFMDVLPMRAKHLVLDQLYVRQVTCMDNYGGPLL
ncbi:hypothetical protein Cgig2_019168 [Carnegiea gigantea]|uniref:Ubiquitin-like protease family profile domain-containing protein n=1 Tax=Carnegiea gigantea TaxID=171969 RepID=A0A9Q1JK77_9CARY|nr:hypothetical protein Cgig2_019168 [Carnegiea gigantea]